jgi:protein-S-isoprenylcysteine O-methyltransferase Ste14
MEGLVVLFALIRSTPARRTDDSAALAAALFGTFLGLAFQPGGAVISAPLSLTLGFLGVIVASVGYLSLNTSFGLTPANRGIKTDGLYRFVRHPIYSSYLPLDVGYVLGNASLINVGILLLLLIAFLVRIHYEEELLMHDERYRAYVARVRYRLVPYLY